jgi:hypothetical protein
MTLEQTQAAIEPGSTEYGERDVLEGGIAAALGGAEGGAAPAPEAGMAPAPPAEEPGMTPMDFLSGDGHTSDLPVTSGLDYGPGEGPLPSWEATDTQRKLQELAQYGRTAAVRRAALQALMAVSGEVPRA